MSQAMPFETTFRTRGYEIDPDGLLRPALYLRYCEHARWEALSASDELDELFRDGRAMVVVAQKLALARDVGYPVALRVSFAVGRIGRTSLDFHQQVVLAETGDPVACARITAVHLGPDGRPAPVPELLRPAPLPELQRSAPLPELALPMPLPLEPDAHTTQAAVGFSHELTVRPSDADLLGHVNHARHLDYLDDARRLGAAAGHEGLAGRLRAVAIDYHQEARPGDRLQATVWPLDDDGPAACDAPRPVAAGDPGASCGTGAAESASRQLGGILRRADSGLLLTRARLQLG